MRRAWKAVAGAVVLAAACGRPAPKAKEAAGGKLEAILRDVHVAGPCASVAAQEWPASRPVPADGAGGRRFKIFFYPLSGGRMAGPMAEAVLDADAGAAVECRSLPGVPKDVAGSRWAPEAMAMSVPAFEAKAAELDQLTEEAAAAYAARRAPTADADLARRYLAAFMGMAEPSFLPDYYRLNPAFWEWVRAAAGQSIDKA